MHFSLALQGRHPVSFELSNSSMRRPFKDLTLLKATYACPAAKILGPR